MNEDTRSLTELANAAFREAAKTVVRRARQHGTSIVVWEDGRVRELSPDEVEAALPPAEPSSQPAPGERPPRAD